MAIRIIDRAGGGVQTFRAWTPAGHVDQQVALSADQALDVDLATLPQTPSQPRQNVLAGGAVSGVFSAPVVKCLRYGQTYTGVADSEVVEEDTDFRMVRLLAGTFVSGASTWVGGDGNIGGGADGTQDIRRNRAIRWSMRVETRAGMPGASVRVGIENDGGTSIFGHIHPGNDTFFDRLWVEVTTPTAAPASVTVVQNHELNDADDESANFVQTVNGVQSIARHSGIVPVGGGVVTLKRFWEEYPKGLVVAGSLVQVDLWPNVTSDFTASGSFGSGKHLFLGIWSKWHEFAIAPTEADAKRLLWPPAAFPELDDLRSHGWFLGPVLTDPDPLIAEGLERWEDCHRMLHDPTKSTDGLTLHVLAERRGYWPNPRQCVVSQYGWQRFRCIVQGFGEPAMNVYDWGYILWLHALRHKDAKLWTLAEEMSEHSRDMDQWKVRRDDDTPEGRAGDIDGWGIHGVFSWEDHTYNSAGRFQHFGPQAAISGSSGSHTFNGFAALGWFLTGDPTYRYSTLVGAEGLWERHQRGYKGYLWANSASQGYHLYTWDGELAEPGTADSYKFGDCSRCFGWPMLMMVNAYRVTKDSAWLDRAYRFADNLAFMEHLPYIVEAPANADPLVGGGSGDIGGGLIPLTGGYNNSWDLGLGIVTFDVYYVEPLIECHRLLVDAGRTVEADKIGAFLERILNYYRTKRWVGGQVSADGLSRIPWQTSYRCDPIDPVTLHPSDPNLKNNGQQLGYNQFAASLAVYVGERILRPRGEGAEADAIRQWALELIRDQYLLTNMTNAMDRSTFIPWTVRGRLNMGQGWPQTNMYKMFGWFGRGGQIALDTLAATSTPEPEEIMANLNLTITLQSQTHSVNYTGMQVRFQRSTDGQVTWTDVQTNTRALGTTQDAYAVPAGQNGHYRGVARLTDGTNFSPDVPSNVGQVQEFNIQTPSTVTLTIV